MKIETEQALLGQEPDMPGLSLLLDEQALLDVVQLQLPAADISRIRIDYLRYKPGTGCLAGLRVFDVLGRSQHAFARVLPRDSAAWPYQSRRLLKRSARDGRFSAHVLPAWHLLLASAVHDRRITALASLLHDPDMLTGHHSLPDDFRPWPAPHGTTGLLQDAPATLYDSRLFGQVLRYKPERRLVMRLQQDGRPRGLLRACIEQDFEATLAGAQLAQTVQSTPLLAVDAARHCLVLPWLAGQSLDRLFAAELPVITPDPLSVTDSAPSATARRFAIEAADLSLLTDVGQLLSNLHQTSAPHPIQRHTAHDIDALQQACTTLAYLQPDLADEVRTLCARTTLALQQGIWQPRITHGDMSLEQLVRNDLGQILIIDWDSAAWGDPMADFGSLLARLVVQHLQRHRPFIPLDPLSADDGTAEQDWNHPAFTAAPSIDSTSRPVQESLELLEAAREALLEGHGRILSFEDRKRAGWHTVAHLLRMMPEGFRRRRADWPTLMQQILQVAQHLAGRLQPIAPPVGRTGVQAEASQERPAAAGVHGEPSPQGATTAKDAQTNTRTTASETSSASSESSAAPSASSDDPATWPQTDRALMQPLLLDALHLRPDAWTLQPVQVLRHKAGRRALLEYRLLPSSGSDAQEQILLGKLRFKGADRHGFRVQQALHARGFSLPWLAVPEALAILPEQKLWLQRKVPGVMATRLLRPGSSTELATRIGRALAALHHAGAHLLQASEASFLPHGNPASTPSQAATASSASHGAPVQSVTVRPLITKRWTLEDELQMLHQRLREAAALRPQWAGRIEALIPATQRLGAHLLPNPTTGIHRDCYADQVLVDGEELYWLDLDLFCEGDPALDVGNFIAHLMEDGLRHHGDIHALRPHQDALLEAFLQDSPQVNERTPTGWTLLALARHIYLSTRFPDRHHTTLPLLEYCEAQLRP